MDDLERLLQSCFSCRESCFGVDRTPEAGIYPRGFYYDFASPRRELLVVSNCPGTIKPTDVAAVTTCNRIRSREDPLKVQLDMTKEAMFGPEAVSQPLRRWVGSAFHENLAGFLCEVFQCGRSDLQQHVSFTNVVKCQGTQSGGTVPEETYAKCKGLYLTKELELLNPTAVLMNGVKARDHAAEQLRRKGRKGIPFEAVPHTSLNGRGHGQWGGEWAKSIWPWWGKLWGSPRYVAITRLRRILGLEN